MELRNYGKEEAFVGGELVDGSGAEAESFICFGGTCQTVEETIDNFEDGVGVVTLEDVGDSVSVEVRGHEFEFPVSRHRQIIFIMQKDVEDESFVAVG